MSLTPLPTPPTTADPTTFDARADAWVLAQQNLVVEWNGELAVFNDAVTAALAAVDARVAQAGFVGTSSTSLAISVASKTFTAQPGRSWAVGSFIGIASVANPANFMLGQITAYNPTTGVTTASVDTIGGSGTFADWAIGITAKAVQPGRTLLTRSAWFNAG